MGPKRDAVVGGLAGLSALAISLAGFELLSFSGAWDNTVLVVFGVALAPGLAIVSLLGAVLGLALVLPMWLMAHLWAGANVAIYVLTVVAWRRARLRAPVIVLWTSWVGVAFLLSLLSSVSE